MTARLYVAIVSPLLAALATLTRWLVQGSGNVYTDFAKDFYVPDPDLAWRLTSSSTTWIGLDAVLMTVAVIMGVAGGVFMLLRVERKRQVQYQVLRRALQGIGLATLVIPAWAFASGSAPAGARDLLPDQGFVSAPSEGLLGSLPGLAAGDYRLRTHKGTQITAVVKAGGETFEARFSGDPDGFLRLDPNDLTQPMSAQISVASESVDTGIELRSKHAREEMRSDEFPRIQFSLLRVLSTGQDAPNKLSFSAEGELSLIGQIHPVHLIGTLTAPDQAGVKRLGFGVHDLLILKAAFSISIEKSAIENDGTFDADSIPIQISLVLVRDVGGQTNTP